MIPVSHLKDFFHPFLIYIGRTFGHILAAFRKCRAPTGVPRQTLLAFTFAKIPYEVLRHG